MEVEEVIKDRTLVIVIGVSFMWALTCITFLVYQGFTAEIRSALVILSQVLGNAVTIMTLRPKAVQTSENVIEIKEQQSNGHQELK